ncbi:MAG: hypothetical protein KIS66_01150 [Fimbriimonadaceae bacterium]|nr:hypothetical protein [Fimbriimonadaceae bacterium]
MDVKNAEGFPPDWLAEMKRGNDLTAELIRFHKDWRFALRNGLLAGLGGVIGATLLVSLLLWMVQPLKRLEMLKPTLDRIAEQLEQGRR